MGDLSNEASPVAVEMVLFQHVMEGNLNCTWNEEVIPPIPMFQLTEKGKREVQDLFGRE